MTDSNPKCNYHPNRDGITKCEMCGKLICVECKSIFRQPHQVGAGDNRSIYVTQYELCQPCFYDRNIKVINSPGNKYGFICFGFFFIAMAIVILSVNSSVFSNAPILSMGAILFILVASILIGIGIRNIKTAPKKIEQMKTKKEEFLKSLSSAPQAPASTDSSNYTYCPHCGDKVDSDEKICDKCGGDLIS